MLDQNYLKSILSYDRDSGHFLWISVSKYHNEKIGLRAGTISSSKGKDYEVIRINGKGYRSHRLAWLYCYGVNPAMIDHINGNSVDNKIENLREVTSMQNNQNHCKQTKNNGIPVGVSKSENGYRARITANGVVHYLGVFNSMELASCAYEDKRDLLHDAPSRIVNV